MEQQAIRRSLQIDSTAVYKYQSWGCEEIVE